MYPFIDQINSFSNQVIFTIPFVVNGEFLYDNSRYFVREIVVEDENEISDLILRSSENTTKRVIEHLYSNFYNYWCLFLYNRNYGKFNEQNEEKYRDIFNILTEYMREHNIDPFGNRLPEIHISNIINILKEKGQLFCTWGPCQPANTDNIKKATAKALLFQKENPRKDIRFKIVDENGKIAAFITVSSPVNYLDAKAMGKDVFDIGYFVSPEFEGGKGIGLVSCLVGAIVFSLETRFYNLNPQGINTYASCAPDNVGSRKILTTCYSKAKSKNEINSDKREEEIVFSLKPSNYNGEIRAYFNRSASDMFLNFVLPAISGKIEKLKSFKVRRIDLLDKNTKSLILTFDKNFLENYKNSCFQPVSPKYFQLPKEQLNKEQFSDMEEENIRMSERSNNLEKINRMLSFSKPIKVFSKNP